MKLKERKRTILLSILIFLMLKSYGQNLVPNESFEDFHTLNCRILKNDYDIQIKEWFSPNPYDGPLTASNTFDSASCIRFLANPRTGKVSMMIRITNEFSANESISYLETKLLNPIEPGKKYRIAFWMKGNKNAPRGYNNISVALSNKEIKSFSERLQLNSVVKNSEINYYDENGWTKYSIKISSKDQYKYILIGCFLNTRPNEEVVAKMQRLTYYYYIDDVTVYELQNDDFDDFKVGEKVVLENIYFDHNQATLKPSSFNELEKLKSFLKLNEQTQIEISGHTDNNGDKIYNQLLSERRANAICDYLRNSKINPAQFTCRGFGDSKPINSNDTDEGRSKNRRVEFIILAK